MYIKSSVPLLFLIFSWYTVRICSKIVLSSHGRLVRPHVEWNQVFCLHPTYVMYQTTWGQVIRRRRDCATEENFSVMTQNSIICCINFIKHFINVWHCDFSNNQLTKSIIISKAESRQYGNSVNKKKIILVLKCFCKWNHSFWTRLLNTRL